MLSFYLDYYPGYRDKETMKVIRHESLGIYIYANPKNKREQDFNEVMAEKAEAIRCRRFESVVNERYDFFDKYKLKADFLEYFRNQLRKHDPKWEFVYLHFSNFVHGKCTFEELDIDLCNKFREYLLTAKKLKRNGHITRNSASGYWSTFRGLLKILYRNGLIRNNVNDFLEKIEAEDVVKDYLSVEELYKLAETPCKKPMLKTASLFSCMTSLRISDILALCWEDIVDYSAGGKCVHIVTKKNRSEDIIPISEEALDLIDYSPDKRGMVFKRHGVTEQPHVLRMTVYQHEHTRRRDTLLCRSSDTAYRQLAGSAARHAVSHHAAAGSEQPRYLLRQYGQQRRFVGPLDGLPSDDRNGHRQMPYVRPVARSGHHHPFDCMGLPRCEGIPYRQGLLPRSHRRQQTQGTYQRNQSFHANHSEMRLSPRRTLRSLFTRYKITRLSGKEITLITVCHTKITGGR